MSPHRNEMSRLERVATRRKTGEGSADERAADHQMKRHETAMSTTTQAEADALFPTPESRPRQQEVLIVLYRKGKIDEALRAFRKIYVGIVDQTIDYLNSRDRNPPVLKAAVQETLKKDGRQDETQSRTRLIHGRIENWAADIQRRGSE